MLDRVLAYFRNQQIDANWMLCIAVGVAIFAWYFGYHVAKDYVLSR